MLYYIAYQNDKGWRIFDQKQTEEEARAVYNRVVVADPIFSKAIITDRCQLIEAEGEYSLEDTIRSWPPK